MYKKKDLLMGLFLVLFLTSASSTGINNKVQYCYALISPIDGDNNGSSRVIKAECFDNFADSIYAATNGHVQLDHSARPEEVTNEVLNSNNGLSSSLSSQVVIGIDWDSTNFGGSPNTWAISGGGGNPSCKKASLNIDAHFCTSINRMEKNMKLYKLIFYTSLVVITIAGLLLASLPIRFPNSTIAWKSTILFLSPSVELVFLLFAKPLLSSKVFLALTILLAGIAVWGTIAGWMSPILLMIFLATCFILYMSSGTSQFNFHRR